MTRIAEAPKTERTPIPVGQYVLTLREIKEHESPDIFATEVDPDTGEKPLKKQLIWIFEADKKAPDGKPYEHAMFTGLYYGDDRANLTKLLDWMLPDESHDVKRKGFDSDVLIGRNYKARIQLVKNMKGDLKPKITMLDPIDASTIGDPFDPDTLPGATTVVPF